MEASAQSNGSGQSPWAAHEAAAEQHGRPEIPVIAALVGGFVLAKLINALGPGEDD